MSVDSDLAEMLVLHGEGQTFSQIGLRLGYSTPQVRSCLAVAGVPGISVKAAERVALMAADSHRPASREAVLVAAGSGQEAEVAA